MMKLKYLFENYDLAKMALKSWRCDEDGLEDMLRLFRISSNAVYPFKLDGRLHFLRLAPAEEKLRRNVYGELEFIDYLRRRGYPALLPAPSVRGNTVELLDTPWGEYYACVFEGVPGVQLSRTGLNEAVLLEYGRTLGRLHALSSEFRPVVEKWSHSQVLAWIEKELSLHPGQEKALGECAEVAELLSRIPRSREVYGLIHYDFEPDNVFYDAEKRTCPVIDFDDGMYHWYALDLEQAADSLEEVLTGGALEDARGVFLSGYRSEFDLPEELLGFFPLFRRFIHLYGYARVLRAVAERWENEPDWMTELREKLGRKLAGTGLCD